MTEIAASSGYYIERTFAQELRFRGLSATTALPEKFQVEYSWEWAAEDERFFYVVLGARGLPAKDRPEEIQVSMVGRFRREGTPERPPFIDFVMLNATTILAPYVREAFADLSGRGAAGRLTLPLLNVVQMVSTMKFEISEGAKQLLARPDVARAYGIPDDMMLRVAEIQTGGAGRDGQ